jgi:hypothetical protein
MDKKRLTQRNADYAALSADKLYNIGHVLKNSRNPDQ